MDPLGILIPYNITTHRKNMSGRYRKKKKGMNVISTKVPEIKLAKDHPQIQSKS